MMKLLAKKHEGMRECFSGFMRNLSRERCNPRARWMLEQLHGHLTEMAKRYYAGDVTVVDEFCQLYCFGEEARKAREKQEVSHD